jgi:integrase
MWQKNNYVFVTQTCRPVAGRNLYRSLTRIAKGAGIRIVRLHDAHHGLATLMADSGVEPRLSRN